MQSPGIAVPPHRAEATRRRLRAEGVLRDDLGVIRLDGDIVFPVTHGGTGDFDFPERDVPAKDYRELLAPELQTVAPRAHEVLGDIAIVKVPSELWDHRSAIGEALVAFAGARAAFHDHGVKGEFRTRGLERIAGAGGAQTTVAENGVRLHIDVTRAYYSPRLAEERRRVTELASPAATVIDLFGGVAPLGVQLAKKGCRVTSIDLNPAAGELARANAAENGVDVTVQVGDARKVAAGLEPADHVVMNLPHGAKDFLDVAAAACAPGGMVHYHEIMGKDERDARGAAVLIELAAAGRVGRIENVRTVRDYSTTDAHFVFDIRLA